MEQSAVVRSTLVLLVLLFASPGVLLCLPFLLCSHLDALFSVSVNSCGAGQFSGCLGCYNCPSGRWANGDSECCFGTSLFIVCDEDGTSFDWPWPRG